MNDHELKHFGIPGMKWGVRRKSSGEDSSKEKSTPSADHVYTRELLSKKNSHLTNAELKDLTTRIDMEKKVTKYRNETNKREKTLKIVEDLTAAGTTIAGLYALSRTPLFQDIHALIKDKERLAKYKNTALRTL